MITVDDYIFENMPTDLSRLETQSILHQQCLINQSNKEYWLVSFDGSIEKRGELAGLANPNKNAPIIFQSIKEKLKEFGIDLDNLS